jgi:hypothetical protein
VSVAAAGRGSPVRCRTDSMNSSYFIVPPRVGAVTSFPAVPRCLAGLSSWRPLTPPAQPAGLTAAGPEPGEAAGRSDSGSPRVGGTLSNSGRRGQRGRSGRAPPRPKPCQGRGRGPGPWRAAARDDSAAGAGVAERWSCCGHVPPTSRSSARSSASASRSAPDLQRGCPRRAAVSGRTATPCGTMSS